MNLSVTNSVKVLGVSAPFGFGWQLHKGLATAHERPESLGHALRGSGAQLLLPQTADLLALDLVTYASFLTLLGLWLGPLLMHRHDMTLVQTGILALVVSLLSLFTPALLDHFDPGPAQRRQWIVRAVLAMATVLTLMAFVPLVWVDFGGMMELAVLSGAGILQHANVRASYITEMSGRAMSVFTMAMFSGCCHRAEPEWHCGFVVAGLRAGYLCGCIRAWHLC